MNANDIVIEASEFGVLVSESPLGTTRFYANSFEQHADAWCSKSTGRQWICHNSNGKSYLAPSKAKAYNWCLDQAANGAT